MIDVDLREIWVEIFGGPYPHYNVRCPFHGDTNASLKIYKDHFHCFGCGIHGDIFDLIKFKDKVNFRTARRIVKKKYGIDIERKLKQMKEKKRIREIIGGYQEILSLIDRYLDMITYYYRLGGLSKREYYNTCDREIGRVETFWVKVNYYRKRLRRIR